MKIAIGDIVDRYSICKLKSERLSIENSKELNELKLQFKDIQMYDEIFSVECLESCLLLCRVGPKNYQRIPLIIWKLIISFFIMNCNDTSLVDLEPNPSDISEYL